MKPWKLICALGLVGLLMLSPVSATAAMKVAMVTDIGGLGDQSFNDAAYAGLKLLEAEYGVEIKVVESRRMEDYVPNLTSLVNQGYDMIWAIGFLMQEALTQVAAEFPDSHFGIIDAEVAAPNVVSVLFKEEEGSFLVGLVAGAETKKDRVGFVGGMEFPLIQKFEAGYKAGVKAANPKAVIRSAYAGSFDDPAKGKELAIAQFMLGADIVYHAAGATGLGVIEAAQSRGGDRFAIGVDMCQHHLAPDNVITCMIKRVDLGVFEGTKTLIEGDFVAGTLVLGLAEDGVGICEASKESVSAGTLALVEEFRSKIVSGELVVPTDPTKL
jgi:basic membrane protein A